jgi:hypothetical protein
MMKELQE